MMAINMGRRELGYALMNLSNELSEISPGGEGVNVSF